AGGPAMHEKIFRDPVHDFITVRDPLLVRLIDTPEFQRLRRLRQLGTAAGTYHGAEHSRFGHCLGAMHVMGKVLQRLREAGAPGVDEELERLGRAAALLHDIGHGPFSHGLERVITPSKGHEQWTRAILSGPSGVREVLESAGSGFADQVQRVLTGELPPALRWLHHLVAGQLDVDRMDYLLRDALYTGAAYGRFDLERLINTLLWVDGQVVFSYKGIPTAEEYVLARHYMYWQVYFHKTTRAQDLLLQAAWRRARELLHEGRLRPGLEVPPSLEGFLRDGDGSLEAYLAIDDHDVVCALKQWQHAADPILADLAGRFLHRRLLKPLLRQPRPAIPDAWVAEAREVCRRRGWNPDYYCLVDRTSDIAYDYYTEAAAAAPARPPLMAVDEFGRLRELSRVSEVIRALATRPRSGANLYVPEECREEILQRVRHGE
ncbi:MAG TPA: HD domain-containing protein, partial [Limnochordales bacterium]